MRGSGLLEGAGVAWTLLLAGGGREAAEAVPVPAAVPARYPKVVGPPAAPVAPRRAHAGAALT